MAVFKSNGFTVEFEDNTGEVRKALENAIDRGLRACGEIAVGYAQDLCPVDTGNLRGSITYAVDGQEVYIGTNVDYAPYIEFGTGIYAETGGRQTEWSWQDKEGNWHKTNGARPQPFIRPSASNHTAEYMAILKDSLENA